MDTIVKLFLNLAIISFVVFLLPSVNDYPLPDDFFVWFGTFIGYFKAIISLPIIEHIWGWILNIVYWFLFPFVIINVSLLVIHYAMDKQNDNQLK